MKKIIIAIISISVLISCQNNSEHLIMNSDNEKAITVRTEELSLSTECIKLSYSGTIDAEKTIPLTFQTTGTVKAIYVEEGDYVIRGQLLAETDKQSMQNAYNAAIAKYDQAVDAYNRLETVWEAGSLPEIKWIEIESKVKQAKANLNIYRKNLDNCEMRAPDNGFIGKRDMEIGVSAIQFISPIEIVKIEYVYANISIPENEINFFEKGQKAIVIVSAINNQNFAGIVEHIGVVADKISRTYKVKIKIKNNDIKIKPGMVCKVKIDMELLKSQLLVPITAINQTSINEAYVYVVNTNNNRALKKQIEIGGIINNKISVISGIKPGELIITSGSHKLSDNTLISY